VVVDVDAKRVGKSRLCRGLSGEKSGSTECREATEKFAASAAGLAMDVARIATKGRGLVTQFRGRLENCHGCPLLGTPRIHL
jgi:hypothetical protein